MSAQSTPRPSRSKAAVAERAAASAAIAATLNAAKPVKNAKSAPVRAKSKSVKSASKIVKRSTDTEELPTDLASLRALLKISRDRRWRAGRRDDAALVATMSASIEKITAAIAALTSAS